MASEPWTFIVNRSELRIQQDPDDPTHFNFDVASDGLFLVEGYYTVKVKKNQVRYKSWEHLEKVVEGLERYGVSNLPEEVQSAANEIVFVLGIPF